MSGWFNKKVNGTKFTNGNVCRLVDGALRRAKIAGVPCATREVLVFWINRNISDVCPALGIDMVTGTGVCQNASPTLHRFNPALGYVPGNIAIICFQANKCIGDYQPDEMMRAANFQANALENGGAL
jgi:hypothetical protein